MCIQNLVFFYVFLTCKQKLVFKVLKLIWYVKIRNKDFYFIYVTHFTYILFQIIYQIIFYIYAFTYKLIEITFEY